MPGEDLVSRRTQVQDHYVRRTGQNERRTCGMFTVLSRETMWQLFVVRPKDEAGAFPSHFVYITSGYLHNGPTVPFILG